MRILQVAAMAAGLSLAAGASQAAVYTYFYVDTVAQGASRTYVFDNVDSGFEIEMILNGEILHIFPGWITTTPFSTSTPLVHDVGYRESIAGPDYGKIDMYVALNNQTLTLLAENRSIDQTGCLPSNPFVCGATFDPAIVIVRLPSDNAGPSVTTGAVPEPGVWALMIAGFGLVGASLRRGRRAVAAG